ncbi:methyl-accepting chemotaxis protein [Noviherbaspirillum autotrophicum]|uniref:Chemotaxis protein n=1 Tax=Noviherbaspirillum autotrophicum TaxID=709839 RepID=A0A0C2BQ49_9BURK|nr:methyl-accepting chemotaxis protein [Noviherbaspirillum autotrophicum]KIF80196.1 chemotaxis protein [Noviherbaspirillum autotrophicum]
MKINNLKIGRRLGLGFALILALMVLLAAVGAASMNSIQKRLDGIVEINIRRMELMEQMSSSVHIVARVSRSIVLLADENEINEQLRKITDARGKYDAALAELEKLPASEEGKALRAKIKEAQEAVRPMNDRIIELAKANKDAEATELLLKQAGPATQTWQDLLEQFIDLQQEISKKDAAAAHSAFEQASLLMSVLTAAAVLLGAFIAWHLTRSITRPLNAAMSLAQAVAGGDLTRSIAVEGRDETAQLMQSLKNMNESLARIVGEVRRGTDTIATASSEIASGNQDLSSRTEQQAGSLEETASSMEELTSTVKQNADNALQANQLARSASEVAAKGGAVVAQVVETMGAINDSARKIADIIGVIDGIAFQTNILALNAAVEAARAGEQGRGFAVVASEVRNLAQRSATAAKDIKALISDSVEKVGSGAKLVDAAGATMEEVVAGVKRVTDIMDEITAASREQASGIAQVNDAITQMDQVTQQNAALVEEAAAAAESLQDQAAGLARAVSVFRVDGLKDSIASAEQPRATSIPSAIQRRRAALPTAANKSAPARKLAHLPPADGGEWETF